MLQASRDEHKYFEKTNKIFSKDVLKESEYKRQIPDYLRLMEDPRNQVKLSDVDKTGMVTIVSKNQGWITVTPRSMNRRKPFERGGNANDNTKTSILTPSWMQIPVPEGTAPKGDPLHATTFGILKKEANRTFLAEKDQPKKSVFSLGGMRHNVPFADQASETMRAPGLSVERARGFEWREEPKR